ncbi:MAG: hypothetical protein M3417_15370 [Actinomycetota bacterium]|nr:hypothetical protein [Actinomycetota bacterium]
MSTETDRFTSTLLPAEVLDGFEALAAEKGWKLGSNDAIATAIRERLSGGA